jgi:putative membrane protein
LLTGFMVGSLIKVWPWKETLTTRINSKGEEVPLMQSHILPSVDDQLLFAALFMFVGASVVFLLERVAGGLSGEKV